MTASRVRGVLGDVIARYVPTPSRIILMLVVLALGVAVASQTWHGVQMTPTGPVRTATVTITPDDPAAATPVPVQSLGR